jgi:hypothetical protein
MSGIISKLLFSLLSGKYTIDNTEVSIAIRFEANKEKKGEEKVTHILTLNPCTDSLNPYPNP